MSADRMILTALLAIGLSACGPTEPAPTESGVAEPSPSGGLTNAISCPTIDLRSPSGARVDLTGTWRADIATLPGATADPIVRYVRQFGSCIWWEELDAEPGRPTGESYRRLFFGSLRSDFTVIGQFEDVSYDQAFDPSGEFVVPKFGRATWRVDITTSGDEDPHLARGPGAGVDLTGTPATWVFSRIDTSTAR